MGVPDLAAAIEQLVDDAVASGAEVGVQVAVVRHGRTVVDIARGTADPRTGAPMRPDTLVWSGSAAKGLASAVAHAVIDRGDLHDDLPLAEVWPAFGAHGKGGVTVRHVLGHTAGVPFLPPDTTVSDLCDWERMCAVLADSPPAWPAGTQFGYHAKTFGFLLGEALRRATGRPISAVLREQVTGPLGIADEVHFGVPSRLLPNVARQVAADEPAPPRPASGSPADRAMPPGVVPDAAYANRPDVLAADIPSEGTMSARGAARLYAALLGHVDGVALVSPARRAAMAAPTYTGTDAVMGVEATWAYGFSPFRPNGRGRPGSTFGMVGMNGSAAFADIDTGLAAAVTRTRFGVGDLTVAARVDQLIHDLL